MIYILTADPNGEPPTTPYEFARTVAVLMRAFGGPSRWPSGN
jgi:hypothetical protein